MTTTTMIGSCDGCGNSERRTMRTRCGLVLCSTTFALLAQATCYGQHGSCDDHGAPIAGGSGQSVRIVNRRIAFGFIAFPPDAPADERSTCAVHAELADNGGIARVISIAPALDGLTAAQALEHAGQGAFPAGRVNELLKGRKMVLPIAGGAPTRTETLRSIARERWQEMMSNGGSRGKINAFHVAAAELVSEELAQEERQAQTAAAAAAYRSRKHGPATVHAADEPCGYCEAAAALEPEAHAWADGAGDARSLLQRVKAGDDEACDDWQRRAAAGEIMRIT